VMKRIGFSLLCGLIVACAGVGEPDSGTIVNPVLTPQRVNAVVRRDSGELLYLETEHQSLVTTPEHPFATVGSGWIPARDLAPGDQVISAKFGSVRVLSVRLEVQREPVPVFNLRVDRSHAYLVGTTDVLVHNTGCGDNEDLVTRKTREIAEAQRELEALKNGAGSTSSEQPHERQKRIADLEEKIRKLRTHLYTARNKAKRLRENPPPPREQPTESLLESHTRDLAQAQAELEALENTQPTSHDEASERETRIAAQKHEVKRLQVLVRVTRHKEKKKRQAEPGNSEREEPQQAPETAQADETQPDTSRPTAKRQRKNPPAPREAPQESAFDRNLRELSQAKAELEALKNTQPTSHEESIELEAKIAAQKEVVRKLDLRVRVAKSKEKKKTQAQPGSSEEPTQPRAPRVPRTERAENPKGEDPQKALEAAQAELAALEQQRAGSAAPGPREVELANLIRKYTYDVKKQDELREMQAKLANIEETLRTSRDPRPDLEAEKEKLTRQIRRNIAASQQRRTTRKLREDPEVAARYREYYRMLSRRGTRGPAHLNDPNRPRDTIELLEEELAELEHSPPSPSRESRIVETRARLASQHRRVEIQREYSRVRNSINRAKRQRQSLLDEGRETKAADERIAELVAERKTLVQKAAAERARDILDGVDQEVTGQDLVDSDEEFADQLLQEIEDAQAAREDELAQDTLDADEEMRLLTELMASIPSPPEDSVRSAVERLATELYEERAHFERNRFSLTNEYAFLNSTLGPGHAPTAERMAALQTKIQDLGAAWHSSMQQRLDDTRRLLNDMQGFARLRDEAIEAELVEQIGLIEQELAHPPL